MSKKIIIAKSMKQINNLLNICDGFIIGIKNLSVNLPCYFDMEEAKKIIKLCLESKKEIFVSLNKNIHNNQLIELTNILKELSNLEITGLIFYDIAIVNLNEELGLNLKLVWNQEHLVTNYQTINYWYKKGVFASYLSSELTIDEILLIRKKTSCSLMMNVFGFIPMFTSKRPLVKNYLDKFSLSDNSKINYLEKEGNIYPIISEKGTTVYSSKILNLLMDLHNLGEIDYFVFNSFNINEVVFKEIIELFNEAKGIDDRSLFDKVNMRLDYNIDTGFLYKDTVYKVKKNGQKE